MTEREYQYFMMMSEKCADIIFEEKKKEEYEPPIRESISEKLKYPNFDSQAKRVEFNRKKITIEQQRASSIMTGSTELFNSGVYLGVGEIRENTMWIAYEGLNRISLVNFLEITGEYEIAGRMKYVQSKPKARDVAKFFGHSDEEITRYEILKTIYLGTGVFWLSFGTLFAITESDIFVIPAIYGFFVNVITLPFYWFNKVRKTVDSFQAIKKYIFEPAYQNFFPVKKAIEIAQGYNYELWLGISNK